MTKDFAKNINLICAWKVDGTALTFPDKTTPCRRQAKWPDYLSFSSKAFARLFRASF